MDGDSDDEGNYELTSVRSDESDKSSWSVGRRSFEVNWEADSRDKVTRKEKSGCWPSEWKKKLVGGLEKVTTSEEQVIWGRRKIRLYWY